MPNVIAVGVDGSGPSVVALRWALRLAEVHGAELTAVIARPPTSDPSRESPAELAARTAEIEQHLAQVSRTIAETAQGAPVTVRSLEGNPTEVLLGVSDRVDLLVVGGHGYKGWRRHNDVRRRPTGHPHPRRGVCRQGDPGTCCRPGPGRP